MHGETVKKMICGVLATSISGCDVCTVCRIVCDCSIVTLLSVGSVLYLIHHDHKYIIEDTTVRILKTLGSVQWLKAHNGTTTSLFKTLWLNLL